MISGYCVKCGFPAVHRCPKCDARLCNRCVAAHECAAPEPPTEPEAPTQSRAVQNEIRKPGRPRIVK